jgi:predicted transcriptional regulator
MIEAKEMTKAELAEALGISEWTLQRALDQLHIEGRREMSDRRKVLYPPDTLDRVRQWLQKTA